MDEVDENHQILRDLTKTVARGPITLQTATIVGAIKPILDAMLAGGLRREVVAAGLVRAARDAGLELPPSGKVNLG